MKNMKTKVKLLVSFMAIAIMTAIVGAVGIFGLSEMEKGDNELYYSNLLAISAMADFRETYQAERTQLRVMILSVGDQNEVQKAIDAFAGLEQTIMNAMTEYEKTITDEKQEEAYFIAKNAYLGDYSTAKKGMIEAALAGDFELAYQRLKDAGPVVAPIVNGLNDSASANDVWGHDTVDANTALVRTLTIVQIAVLVLAVAAALFFAFYISGLISKPLAVLTAFMNRAGSKGDIALSREDEELISKYSQTKDEIGQCIGSTATFVKHIIDVGNTLETIALGDLTAELALLSDKDTMGLSLQKMMSSLNSMFGEVRSSTAQVSLGSKQIADGAQALAQGSTEQAASVQQLSSSIAEIAEKTKRNAEMAGKAATLANAIMNNAEKGNSQMGEMTNAVREINEASQSINRVIKVIDDIAFQTNILALNAAVEAARAGQHGKGFAVVAEEVRNLAAKSAEAAKDTGSLIANSMEKAELGARIADETAASLAEIVTGINESTNLVKDIARSSEEQSEGISQINLGIDQVAQVVQQNSATAEESAAASEEMSGQADMLENLIAQFKLKDGVMSSIQRLPSTGRAYQTSRTTPDTAYKADNDGFGKY